MVLRLRALEGGGFMVNLLGIRVLYESGRLSRPSIPANTGLSPRKTSFRGHLSLIECYRVISHKRREFGV